MNSINTENKDGDCGRTISVIEELFFQAFEENSSKHMITMQQEEGSN